jgi:hypothetical protein
MHIFDLQSYADLGLLFLRCDMSIEAIIPLSRKYLIVILVSKTHDRVKKSQNASLCSTKIGIVLTQ